MPSSPLQANGILRLGIELGPSPWYHDDRSNPTAAAAEALPREVVAAAQERGRARDLWETAKELLAELEAGEG